MTRMLGFLVAAIVVLGFVPAGHAQKAYPTNIELVEQAVRAAVDSLDVPPPPGRRPDLQIEAGTGSDAVWLVDNILKGELIKAGWNVRSQGGGPDSAVLRPAEFVLKLKVGDLGLIYARSWRRHLLFGKAVERVARVSIFYDLVDAADATVLVASSVRSERRDVVPASQLAALSDSKYTFAAPALEKSQWDRYVEGGLVLAIVGVLVYLFYSNRTA
jgi:hypothetical protein